jgi:hypothetical protein
MGNEGRLSGTSCGPQLEPQERRASFAARENVQALAAAILLFFVKKL